MNNLVFIENLNNEVSRINVGERVIANFLYHEQLTLQSDEQIILFRIVQEAIQNAIKHANPKKIEVEIIHKAKELVISVMDDGIGFNEKNVKTWNGNK